jgi:uncharacterized protein (TIGR02118 family)
VAVIKRITVVHARHGIDRSEALRYWKEFHAPLVARVPGLRRYVQNHCVEGLPGSDEAPFLGVGEVWFDSQEAAETAIATPEWHAVLDDAATFMDMDRVTAGWAEEHVLV